jgi:hypothetical protein
MLEYPSIILTTTRTKMTIGLETFGISKKEFTEKLSRIITNHRASSKLVGEPQDFVLRACRLTDQWGKLAHDPEVVVYLRNIDTAGGRKVKMISLERGGSRQPVPKAKLLDTLYPPKKMACTATVEEAHYNKVKGAMRNAIHYQLKSYRDSVNLPIICSLTGKKIRPGQRTDVDHIGFTFSEIADSFVQMKGLTYTDIVLKGPPTAKIFKDEILWQEWTQYHLAKARYALVCASANRSKGADGYKTPEFLYGSFSKEEPEDLSLDF